MNATTVNSFPAMHSFNSPRGVALACIVLVHVAFFFALSSGLGIKLIKPPYKGTEVFYPPEPPQPARSVPHVPTPEVDPFKIDKSTPVVPPIEQVIKRDEPPTDTTPLTGSDGGEGHAVVPPPAIVAPEEDAMHRLSAPAYPAAEIRANHAGTVILRVEVLQNGHIGNVELVQSSGFARLDEAAIREARHWRMKPGTRDGVPVVMWKEVPITFQLKDRGSTDL